MYDKKRLLRRFVLITLTNQTVTIMKNSVKTLMAIFFVAALSIGFASCSGDDDDNGGGNGGGGSTELADPEGTSIGSVVFDKNQYSHQYNDYGWGDLGKFYLTMEGLNIDLRDGSSQVQIAVVGPIQGLAEIKSLPKSGYNKTVTAIIGYGYVGIAEGMYIRFYCFDYILDSYGNIIGAIFKYQYPWIPNTK